MIVREILQAALRKCQAATPGQSLVDTLEEENALEALNDLLSDWFSNELLSYFINTQSFNLIKGKNSYSIGVDLDWDIPIPNNILNSYIVSEQNSTNLMILTQEEYYRITNKTYENITNSLFYERHENNGIVFLYPVPSSNCILNLSWTFPLERIDSPLYNLELPPIYYRALKLNLAVDLATEYNYPLTPESYNNALLMMEKLEEYAYKPPSSSVIEDFIPYRRFYYG